MVASLAGLAISGVSRAEEAKEFVDLFDGKTLTGWEGNLKAFRVEDEAIVAGTMKERIPQNEFLCTTKEYANFELQLEVKLIGDDPNAGIQIRSRRIPNHHEMIGYQADLGQGYWGALYDESRRKEVLIGPDDATRQKAVKPKDWNTYRIRCEGRRIQLWLNDIQTVDYTETDESLEQTGLIGLQVHSGPPTEIHYRKIRIKTL